MISVSNVHVDTVVRMDQVRAVDAIFNDPVVYACAELLKGATIPHGFDLVGGGKRASPQLKRVLDRYWKPFIQQLADNILKYGFSPVTTRRTEDKEVIPVVPPLELFITRMLVHKDYSREIQFHDASGHNKSISAVVSEFPSLDGSINSLCARTLEQHTINRDMLRFHLQLEYNRSLPIVYTQTERRADRDNFEVDTLAQTELLAIGDQIGYIREKNKVDHIRAMRQLNEETNGKRRKVLRDPRGSFQYEYGEGYNNLYQLPEGVTMGTQPHSATPSNHALEFRTVFERAVCAVFKIPPRMVLRVQNTGRSDGLNNLEVSQFSRAIDAFAEVMKGLVEAVYVQVYGSNDGLEVRFQTNKEVDTEMLLELSDRGLISVGACMQEILNSCGLPKSVLREVAKPPPVPPNIQDDSAPAKPRPPRSAGTAAAGKPKKSV